MITKFKMFENDNPKYNEYDYIGKFCVVESEEDNVKMSIMQCNRVDFPINYDINVFISFDRFDIDDNDNIINPVGDNESLSIEDFKKINFMTATEFYNSYKYICVKLFYKINDLKKEDLEYWCRMILMKFKKELDTIPEFKFFIDSDKFNI